MSEHSSNILQLNFSDSSIKELLKEKKSIIGWESEIFSFLEEWDANPKTITVQTSGSTGKSKSIQLEKKYMKASARATLDFFNLRKGDSALLCLPVRYIAGKMMLVRAIVGGLNLYCIEPSLKPVFGSGNFTFTAMTPAQVSELLQSETGVCSFDNIQKVIVGGSSIPNSLEQEMQKMETQIWHTYGMTETITHIAMRKVNGINASQWFTTLSGVEFEVARDGCLQIDAPNIGVHQLKTNDQVEISGQGFRIFGRKDNVVNSGGIKLFPESIERKIETYIETPFFLCGVSHEQFGQVLGMVVQKSTRFKSEDDILTILKTKLNGLEVPKHIKFVEEIEFSPNGKIVRKW